jgi:hypothetical protein
MQELTRHAANQSLTDTRSETTDDSIEELVFKRRYSFPIDGLEEDIVDPVFEQTVDEIK